MDPKLLEVKVGPLLPAEVYTIVSRTLSLCRIHHAVGDAFSAVFPYPSPMMEMEANHFLDRVNRLTYDIAENVHPAHLDREEDLSDYLSKVQSSVVNDVPHLDASHSVIDLMGHSMRHQVFDKIHSFVEIAEAMKGSGCQTTPTIGDHKSNPREAVRELQDILKEKGESILRTLPA